MPIEKNVGTRQLSGYRVKRSWIWNYSDRRFDSLLLCWSLAAEVTVRVVVSGATSVRPNERKMGRKSEMYADYYYYLLLLHLDV